MPLRSKRLGTFRSFAHIRIAASLLWKKKCRHLHNQLMSRRNNSCLSRSFFRVCVLTSSYSLTCTYMFTRGTSMSRNTNNIFQHGAKKNWVKNVRKSGIRQRNNELCLCPLNVINSAQFKRQVTWLFPILALNYTQLKELFTKLQNVERLFGSHVRQVTPRNHGHRARNRNVIQYGGGKINSPHFELN